VTLLLAAGTDPARAAAALRGASGTRAQERRLEQASAEARAERLALHTGVVELDEALEWAKARLRGAVARQGSVRSIRRGGGACAEARAEAPDGPRSTPAAAREPAPLSPPGGGGPPSFLARSVEPVWVALGALACGDPEPSQVLLEGELSTPYHLWLAGRYASWTGDSAALLPHRELLEAALAVQTSGAPTAPLRAAAARELADAWEGAGERALADTLRALGRALERVTPAAPAGGRGLPVVGAAPALGPPPSAAGATRRSSHPPPRDVLTAITATHPPRYEDSPSPPAGGVERALRAWALCRAGDPEAGYRLLREHLDAGLGGGAGMWREFADGREGCRDHAASAALAPAALLFGLLGARADAAAGRVHLAPRLPSAWRSFSVTGVIVGDARISLRYVREGAEHTFAVQQLTGRVPLMAILEPEVRERVVGEVRVDGVAADLDLFRRGERSRIRVQLPLDRERTVSLVGDEGRE
jgi:hypothetical protein